MIMSKCYNKIGCKSYNMSRITGGRMESFCSSKSIFSGISKSYLEDNSFREQYYTYDPDNSAAWKERMGKVTKNSYKRDELTDTLLKLNSSLGGASKVTLNNIEKLRDEKKPCVWLQGSKRVYLVVLCLPYIKHQQL